MTKTNDEHSNGTAKKQVTSLPSAILWFDYSIVGLFVIGVFAYLDCYLFPRSHPPAWECTSFFLDQTEHFSRPEKG